MLVVLQRVGKGAAISDGYLQCLAVMSEDMSNDVSPSSDETVHDRLTFQINDGDDSPGVGDVKIETCVRYQSSVECNCVIGRGSSHFLSFRPPTLFVNSVSSRFSRTPCPTSLTVLGIFHIILMRTHRSLRTLFEPESVRTVASGPLI